MVDGVWLINLVAADGLSFWAGLFIIVERMLPAATTAILIKKLIRTSKIP
jgi:hypothetical protein